MLPSDQPPLRMEILQCSSELGSYRGSSNMDDGGPGTAFRHPLRKLGCDKLRTLDFGWLVRAYLGNEVSESRLNSMEEPCHE